MGLSLCPTCLANLPMETLAHTDGCHRWHRLVLLMMEVMFVGIWAMTTSVGGSDEEEDEDTDSEQDTGSSIDDDDTSASSSDGDGSDSGSEGNTNDREQVITSSTECQGQTDCFRGTVTDIVDGDTLDVNKVRIGLSLVNTPELGDSGYSEAKEFTESVCPIRSGALVDEDDGQKEGSLTE